MDEGDFLRTLEEHRQKWAEEHKVTGAPSTRSFAPRAVQWCQADGPASSLSERRGHRRGPAFATSECHTHGLACG